MNRITIDIALWLGFAAALAHGHIRLHLRPPSQEPPPVVCQFCK